MKLIIGLGNPGKKYAKNRHNVGHMVIAKLTINNLQFTIAKSTTLMNDSGTFVAEKLKAYSLKPEALYIIHDDLDIKLGQYKIQFAKGPKDHNGIEDIENKLGTKDFWRIRIGIDNRPGNPTSPEASRGKEYVLEDFTDEEMTILDNVIKEICGKLKKI